MVAPVTTDRLDFHGSLFRHRHQLHEESLQEFQHSVLPSIIEEFGADEIVVDCEDDAVKAMF
jgi:hypothetical protein